MRSPHPFDDVFAELFAPVMAMSPSDSLPAPAERANDIRQPWFCPQCLRRDDPSTHRCKD
jgi:hypothetical protein